MRDRVHGDALEVRRRVQGRQELADSNRHALRLGVASVRRGLRDLSDQRRRGHLSTRHAVDRVVDEDDRHVLAAARAGHRLAQSDGREVAIALIGEDHVVGKRALHARRDRGSAAVRRLDHVAGEVVVRHHGAADRRDADGLALDAELVDRLRDETVDDAVRAARAVVQDRIRQRLRFLEYYSHIFKPLNL